MYTCPCSPRKRRPRLSRIQRLPWRNQGLDPLGEEAEEEQERDDGATRKLLHGMSAEKQGCR